MKLGLTIFAVAFVAFFLLSSKPNETADGSGSGSGDDDGAAEYFTLADIHSRGTPPPPELVPNAKKLLREMNRLQRELYKINPSYRLKFTSTYRSPAHNTSIGGASKSKHMEAMAADFAVENCPANDVQNLIVKMVREGRLQNCGLGRGKSFTHYNYREDNRNSSWIYVGERDGGNQTSGVPFEYRTAGIEPGNFGIQPAPGSPEDADV